MCLKTDIWEGVWQEKCLAKKWHLGARQQLSDLRLADSAKDKVQHIFRGKEDIGMMCGGGIVKKNTVGKKVIIHTRRSSSCL